MLSLRCSLLGSANPVGLGSAASGSRLIAAGLIACGTCFAPPAGADLVSDSSAIAKAWKQMGATVERSPSRMLARGAETELLLPLESAPIQGCLSVIVIGAPTSTFTLHAPAERAATESISSRVGVIELARCGEARAELEHLVLEVRSPLVILDVISAHSRGNLPLASALLPARNPGKVLPNPDPGPRPRPAPLRERWARIERELQSTGARTVSAQRIERSDGQKLLPVRLEAGCHRFDALADEASTDDVDLLVFVEGESGTFADSSESADASLLLCLATRKNAVIALSGNKQDTVLSHGEYDLPAGLPRYVDPTAAGNLALLLARRSWLGLSDEPLLTQVGVAGSTSLPLHLVGDSCYLATAVTLSGRALDIALSGRVENVRLSAGRVEQGALLTFCLDSQNSVELELSFTALAEPSAPSAAWFFALWKLGQAGAQ